MVAGGSNRRRREREKSILARLRERERNTLARLREREGPTAERWEGEGQRSMRTVPLP